jgi:hypothetical protein
MTDDIETEFVSRDAFESQAERYQVTTAAFDSSVAATQDGETIHFTVEVTVPDIQAVTVEDVGATVATDWFETFERRLADAPKATRATVELDGFEVTERTDSVEIVYQFSRESPQSGIDIAKTFAEYVEGTYVEGVIPGYEYTGAVAELLGDASQGKEGGTPL